MAKGSAQPAKKALANKAMDSQPKNKPEKSGPAQKDVSKKLPKPSTTSATSESAEAQKQQSGSKKPVVMTVDDDAILREEIKLLGGDDEDFVLLKDVDEAAGDAEAEDEAIVVPGKKKDNDRELADQLKSFMKSIGLSGRPMAVEEIDDDEVDEVDDPESDEDQEEAEEDSGDEDEASESDEQELEEASDDEPAEDEDEEEEATLLDAEGAKKLGQLKKAISSALKNGKSASASAAPKCNLVVPAVPLCHSIELPAVEPHNDKKNPMGDSERQKRTVALLVKAQKLWDQDCKRHAVKSRMSASDTDFISHVLRSGTASDKVSALQLLVQESPIHNFSKLEGDLMVMCSKKARREALQAVEAVAELCTGGLLPDRKLRYFADRPLFGTGVTDAHLITWAFEDALKNWYFKFIRVLETVSHDPLAHPKRRAMHRIVDLLSAKPEQEQNLLLLLVNKFGDAEKQIPSLASHLLLNLLREHPAMKLVVISEIERFISRPQTSERARYHAIALLDQIVLSRREGDVKAANKLVEIYFGIFGSVLRKLTDPNAPRESVKPAVPSKKKARHRDRGKPAKNAPPTLGQSMEEFEAKMVAAVLTGINRAWPYSKLEDTIFDKHVDTLFAISHSAALNTAVQALSFICQVSAARQSISDRLCRSVYELMLHPALFSTTHQAPFFNLIYRVLKGDPSQARAQAMLKRLLQIASVQAPPFAVASLFLVGEAFKERPSLWGAVRMPEPKEDDDEEKFVDVKLDDEEEVVGSGDEKESDDEASKPKAAAVLKHERYDPFKREPLHCHADQSCFWELNELAVYFHPTVRLYAAALLELKPIPIPEDAAGYDPLRNHGLMHFLDRFVFKNPRKMGADKGAKESVMKPKLEAVANDRDMGVLFHGGKKRMTIKDGRSIGDVPVNDDVWLRKAEKDGAPEDEKFYLTFFRNKERTLPKKLKSKRDTEGDEDGFGSDDLASDQELDEDEVWQAMARSSGFPRPDDDDGEDDEEVKLGSDSDSASGSDLAEDDEAGMDADSGSEMESGSEDGDMGVAENDIDGVDREENASLSEADEDVVDDDSETEEAPLRAAGAKRSRSKAESDDDEDDILDLDVPGSDEEDAKVASKPTFLAKKALALGYRGDYFGRKKGGPVQGDDDEGIGGMRGFATADDFADLLGIDDGEDFGFDDRDGDLGAADGEKSFRALPAKKKRKQTKTGRK